jgi:hypothetical protein
MGSSSEQVTLRCVFAFVAWRAPPRDAMRYSYG